MDKETDRAPPSRLELIEMILVWEGKISRTRVGQFLDVQWRRASQLLSEFRETNGNWTRWDEKKKEFHPTAFAYQEFESRGKSKASLDRYLSLVGLPFASADSGKEGEDRIVLWSASPSVGVSSPKIFATLANACREKTGVNITYMSLKEPTPHQRTIYPHSLVRTGQRWHVRAFSEENNEYRDYALGRIVDASTTVTKAKHLKEDDKAWNTKVKVRLVAHPDLTIEQTRVIQREYFNDTSARVDICRGALVQYYIQDIRAAVDPAKQKTPEYLIAVENMKEVSPWLFGM